VPRRGGPAQQAGRLGEHIPAGPFLDWLRGEVARLERVETLATRASSPVPARQVLAARLGASTETLSRYLAGLNGNEQPTDVFRRFPVEDMLARAGVPFAVLYPELAAVEDRPVEPAAYCLMCREVTPRFDGVCPWHGGRRKPAAELMPFYRFRARLGAAA
jgi:hypothetical protein